MSTSPEQPPPEQSTSEPTESWASTVAGSAIVQTLAAMLLVSVPVWTVGSEMASALVLAPPILDRPWTLLTSVYAHRTPAHLIGNALVILTAGTIVAYATTTLRFHAFVVLTGALAGVSQILAVRSFGFTVAVLGISGAGFALIGYVVASNRASSFLGDRLSARAGVVVVVLIAGGLTLFLSGSDSALVAHFTGAVLGLVAGRYRLLAP